VLLTIYVLAVVIYVHVFMFVMYIFTYSACTVVLPVISPEYFIGSNANI